MSNEPINPGAVAARLLGLRQSKSARPNLRRGHSPATEHYAYPYLAALWTTHGQHFRTPLLRVGALAATAVDVGDAVDVRLGQHLQRVATAGATGKEARERAMDRNGARIVWAQTGDVEKLHRVLRTLLQGPTPVSWRDVVATYLWWDHPDHAERRDHRRRVLEDFYTPASNRSAPSSEPPIDPAPAA